MGKGVLLELTGRQAVVLTPQGEFKRVPMPKGTWDIGDEIEFAESAKPAWTRWGMAAAAAVMLLVSPVGYNVWADSQPHAIVTVDINPSLELTLNRKDAVLKARALNEDGALVLEGVAWDHKPVDDVLTAVTTRAVAVQKLDPESDSSAVLVAVAPVKADLPKAQADRIRDKSYEAVVEVAGQANVAVLEATAEDKKEAEANGLDVGQQLYYKQLLEQGHVVKPADVKEKGPGKVTQELGINPGEIFSQAQKEHGGEPASKGNKGQGKGQEKNDSKSGSDNGSGATTLPALPVLGQPGQPAVPAQGADKPGQPKDDKQADDRKSDDKQSDDKPGNSGNNGNSNSGNSGNGNNGNGNGNGNSGKSDDRKSDDKPGNSGSKGNTEPPGQAKPKQDEKQEDKKKSSWTVPFLGIEIEKPAFLQDKESKDEPSTDTATEPRANPPGGGPSDDDDQKVEEKPGKGSDPKGKEKPEEKPNKQEDRPGNGQGKDQGKDPKDSNGNDQKGPNNQKGNSGKR